MAAKGKNRENLDNLMKQNQNEQCQKKIQAGRHFCECQAMVHGLVNNCIVCGRIVCEQEAEGPCFFCGNLVYGKNKDVSEFPEMEKKEIEIGHSIDSKMALQQAIEHKQKLQQFQKEGERSNILDVQADWYAIADDVWQSKDNRDIAIKQMISEKNEFDSDKHKIHLDFQSWDKGFGERKIEFDVIKSQTQAKDFLRKIETNQNLKAENDTKIDYYVPSDEECNESQQSNFAKGKGRSLNISVDQHLFQQGNEEAQEVYSELANIIKTQYKPKHQAIAQTNQPHKGRVVEIEDVQNDEMRQEFQAEVEKADRMREQDQRGASSQEVVQDEQLFHLDQDDKGYCLSMLQPWASLLIQGFKRFEGRFWNSDYRGPLWIHAGATPPSKETIAQVEEQYHKQYQSVKNVPPFPEQYPLGSLLGVVDLQAVLDKKSYSEFIPDDYRETSDCDYIFVVRCPRRLRYPIKMVGNKQIFQIDKGVIQIAVQALLPVHTGWYEYAAKKLTKEQLILLNMQFQKQMQIRQTQNQKDLDEKTQTAVQKNEQKQHHSKNNAKIQELEVSQIANSQEQNIQPQQQRKMEYGYLIENVLQQNEIEEIIANQLKYCQKVPVGHKQAIEIPLGSHFPYLEKILQSIPSAIKSELIPKIKKCQYFFTTGKQISFEFTKNAEMVLFLGQAIEISVDNLIECSVKTYKVRANSLILPKQQTRISFNSYPQPLNKSQLNKSELIQQQYYSLFVVFYQ